jgi:hypothetical protein
VILFKSEILRHFWETKRTGYKVLTKSNYLNLPASVRGLAVSSMPISMINPIPMLILLLLSLVIEVLLYGYRQIEPSRPAHRPQDGLCLSQLCI